MIPTSRMLWRSIALDAVLLTFAVIFIRTAQVGIGIALIIGVALGSLAWIILWIRAGKDAADQPIGDNWSWTDKLAGISLGGILGSGLATFVYSFRTERLLHQGEWSTTFTHWLDHWIMMSSAFVIILIGIVLRDGVRMFLDAKRNPRSR